MLIIRQTFFFFKDTATTEFYTLSLHDALPISRTSNAAASVTTLRVVGFACRRAARTEASRAVPMPSPRLARSTRSEEHTSELQSHLNLVCRLLLEKKKQLLLNIASLSQIRTNE